MENISKNIYGVSSKYLNGGWNHVVYVFKTEKQAQ